MENLNTQGRYKRGQIYFVKSTHKEVGTEQWADRPAVIVSNDDNNKCSTAVEVCYMTTRPKNRLTDAFYYKSSVATVYRDLRTGNNGL